MIRVPFLDFGQCGKTFRRFVKGGVELLGMFLGFANLVVDFLHHVKVAFFFSQVT